MPHPDEGLIHAWLDGELDAAEAARVEALVASDPAWAAAAAEARGLIAASARIVGTLDRVPSQVIPKTAPAKRTGRGWIWRVAAAVVLVTGSALVLRRKSPELPEPPQHVAQQVPPAENPAAPVIENAAPAAAQAGARAAKKGQADLAASRTGVDTQSIVNKKELDIPKQSGALRDKDAANATGELRATRADAGNAPAAGMGGARRAIAALSAPPAAPAASAAAPEALAKSLAADQKVSRLPLSCFEQREPRDSAARLIRLEASALLDSIRLEKLTLHGDTLAAVNGGLIAIKVRCPAP